MSASPPTPANYANVPLPALLYASRGTYTDAVQQEQAKAGLPDVPASGEFLLSAMEWSGATVEAVVRWQGVSKQAVSQTVETLVVRGYLERARDPADRRRVKLTLTERGHAAGNAARRAIERLDRELRGRVGTRAIAQARETLIALLEIKHRQRGAAAPGGA